MKKENILILALTCLTITLFAQGVCPINQSPIWTMWLNRDNLGGNGDFERVSDFFLDNNPDVCEEPLEIQCETVDGIPAN